MAGRSPADLPGVPSAAGLALIAALGAAGAAPAQQLAATAASPACSHCQARWQTVDALRRELPADWQLAREQEPVMGGQMLVVRAGRADAPPVLLVHGLGQNGFTDWLPVLPQLAAAYRVVAIDLPGFGYSSNPAAKLSPTNYARVLATLVEREFAGRPVTVVGHSMGGAVALRLAADYPARVGKLVLVSAAGILQRTAFVKHAASLPLSVEAVPGPAKEGVARLRDLAGLLVERFVGQGIDPTTLLRASELGWALALRDQPNVNAAMALVDEDFSAAVHTLPQPVHLIWGEADTIAPLRTGELLARRLPRAQLATLPGVGHMPMETATREFLVLLSHALASAPVPRDFSPPPGASPDLHCAGLVDRRYSGRYREVRIDRCTAVHLADLVAERIIVRNSSVRMSNVQVLADSGIGVEIIDSELSATASDFAGAVAMRLDGARVDLAGVDLVSGGNAVEVARRSRLVASVSRIQSPDYRGYWHDDRELEAAVLDPRRPAVPLPPRGRAGEVASPTAATDPVPQAK
jgi:pimeloyl-ACP methyl ester carboxylesterase